MATLLRKAVISNEIDQINRFLQTPGLDVDALGVDQCTPLCYAVERNYLEAARLLIAAGADVNWTSFHWYSPLQLAARNGHKDMVTLLLDSGADMYYYGSTHLSPLGHACDRGHRQIIQLLIERGADVNKAMSLRGLRALYSAACHDDAADIIEALLAAGADVNGRGTDNRNCSSTPLRWAALRGNRKIVQALLAAKADPNLDSKISEYGNTVLDLATSNLDADVGIIEDIVSHGFNVLLRNKRTGRTALQEVKIYHGMDAEIEVNIRNRYCQIAAILVAAGDRNWGCMPVPCPGIERALLPVWREAPEELSEVVKRLEEDLKETLYLCLRIIRGRLPMDLRMRVLGAVLEK